MRFRNIKEGDGGTLPLYNTNAPRVGTSLLTTCVGVYFQIDTDRCFVAHMYAISAETMFESVTDAGGRDLVAQVKRRLFNFSQFDNWDIKSHDFGKNLIIQCPRDRENIFEGRSYQTLGKFVVQAIREFFEACGVCVESEARVRKSLARPAGPKSAQAKNYDRETERLARKSISLERIATITVVETKYHGFVVSPLTGKTWKFGSMINPTREEEEEERREYRPWPGDWLPDVCTFGVLEDDRAEFPEAWLTTEKAKAEITDIIEWPRNEYREFGHGTGDATSERLSAILGFLE